VNSAWPCVGPSGQSISLPSSSIIACSPSTGAWTSSALYQRSARSSISSLVSSSLKSSSSFGSRVGPRAGDGAAVRRILLVSVHFLVDQQVDQKRAVLLERLGDRRR